MSNTKPILHISIYYQGNSQIKKELRKELSHFSKRLAEDPCNPIVKIRFDTLDAQRKKQVLLELSYYDVVTASFEKPFKNFSYFYTFIAIQSSLTINRFYEKNPNTGEESWLLISLAPLKAGDDTYNIQWCTGYNCCQANHHWDSFQQC